MIGDRDDDGVDVLVVEQLFVAPRGLDRFADDFFRQFVAAIVKITGRDAFHARKLYGIRQQTGTFHADTDNPKTHAVARAGIAGERRYRIRFQHRNAANQ